MGLLGRKSDDFEILDLTLLRKKGILKIPEEKEVVDFTSYSSPANSSAQSMPVQNQTAESNPFGFLDSVAQASSAESTGIPATYSSDSSSDVGAIRIKLDDFEYKLERLIERLEKIESKIGSL